ncbi:MAG TPA: hypothetical protein VG992_04105 [Candidatus Saccharimonadales bacterium]|nr:hypothetical protein [Candidatus Saccharimonadales bacterium]
MDSSKDTSKDQATPKAQLAEKLKAANNILVTVSRNPSVDQLAALIGLGLLLNKTGKHAAAVFSGDIPSTLEFLKPEETIEKNTDSLRDFIIALDKSKADKLRYKLEDQLVRIFITPYRTSITEADLNFSQGDFNVDVVVGLGVQKQEDLDDAITAHGRILHDATVATINNSADGGLGSINWHQTDASSLSEMVTDLAQGLGKDLLDKQIATALLTGIVAQTDRFSNEKTTPQTMTLSSTLMAAGANQQLVATKLDEPPADAASPAGKQPDPTKPSSGRDGTLEIEHDASKPDPEAADDRASVAPADQLPAPVMPAEEVSAPAAEVPAPDPVPAPAVAPEPPAAPPSIIPDHQHTLPMDTPPAVTPEDPMAGDTPSGESHVTPGARFITEPPTMSSTLTAGTQPEDPNSFIDPLSQAPSSYDQLLSHSTLMPPGTPAATPVPPPETAPEPPVTSSTPAATDSAPSVDSARDQINQAFQEQTGPGGALPPITALNAQPMGPPLHEEVSLPNAPSASAMLAPEPLTPQPQSDSIQFDAKSFEVANDPDIPVLPTPNAPAGPAPVIGTDSNSAAPPVPPPLPMNFGPPPSA